MKVEELKRLKERYLEKLKRDAKEIYDFLVAMRGRAFSVDELFEHGFTRIASFVGENRIMPNNDIINLLEGMGIQTTEMNGTTYLWYEQLD